MTAATTKSYTALWTADLKKKCHSQTAGEMASLLTAYVARGVDYPDRARHLDHLFTYLKRTTRLKYRQIDIERVCDLLGHMSGKKYEDLLSRLVKHGLKQHPGSVQLNFQAGIAAVTKKSPTSIPPAAFKHIEKALKLAEASTVPKETALLPQIKQMLTLINELREKVSRMPFGPDPFDFFSADFDFFDRGHLGSEDDDEDEFVDGFDPWPRTVPGPKPTKKRKPRKR